MSRIRHVCVCVCAPKCVLVALLRNNFGPEVQAASSNRSEAISWNDSWWWPRRKASCALPHHATPCHTSHLKTLNVWAQRIWKNLKGRLWVLRVQAWRYYSMRGIHGIVRLEHNWCTVRCTTLFLFCPFWCCFMLQCCFLLQVLLRCAWNGSWNDAPWSPGVELNVLNLDRNLVFLVVGTLPDTYSGHHNVSRADIWRTRAPSEVVDSARKHPFTLLPLRAFRRCTSTSHEITFFWMDVHATICTSCLWYAHVHWYTQHVTIIYIICNYMHKYAYIYIT